ncbi:MAG: hypothetical protein IT433_07290 [Phycisphaerales bacterium]|nr:hypothetical protein [Phycisphaerales bacterium]
MRVGSTGLSNANVDAPHVPGTTHPDPTGAFKALSFQSIIAFAMGFGCAGLSKPVEQQVKAVQGLKIDKITVWDRGTGGSGRHATADFLSGMIGSLPRPHELASQAGIELPPALGKLAKSDAGQGGKSKAEPPKA